MGSSTDGSCRSIPKPAKPLDPEEVFASLGEKSDDEKREQLEALLISLNARLATAQG